MSKYLTIVYGATILISCSLLFYILLYKRELKSIIQKTGIPLPLSITSLLSLSFYAVIILIVITVLMTFFSLLDN
jgi:hypothetical protein